jgi:proteasome lid subunit RPN8/RPN11
MINKVEIQPIAFKKMIFHSLRYANQNLEEKQEVLGICIGNESEDKNIITVTDIIPLIHGDQIEIGLSKELYELFERIKSELNSEEVKIIGWYLSHPGYSLELTDSDKTIHLYFQNENNPNSIAILFDPLKFKKSNNFGVKCLRLKDYKQPETSQELESIIKIPNTLDFFNWVKNLIEDSQRKKPQIINEYEETKKPVLEELQEIPKPDELKKEVSELDKNLETLSSGVKQGTDAFSNDFLEVYKTQIEKWTKDVKNGSLKGTEYIRSSLNQLNKTINKGLEGLQGYFKTKFNEISNIFVKGITEALESRIKSQKNIETDIMIINEEISNMIEKALNENFADINTKLNLNITKLENQLITNEKQVKRIDELIKNNSIKVSEFHSSIDSFSEDMIAKGEKSCNPFEQNLVKLIQDQNINFTSIDEKYKEIEQLTERLQKLISEIRQIK